MNGNRLVIDTNVVINQFKGSVEAEFLVEGNDVFISAISVAELYSVNLTAVERDYLEEYINEINVVHTNNEIIHFAAKLRRKYKIKLPDAIVAATALYFGCPLATSDKGFQRIDDLVILNYNF